MSSLTKRETAAWKPGNPVPHYADRVTPAQIITHKFFPVSPRTLRDWPLTALRPNKRVVYDVKEALSHAEDKLATCARYPVGGVSMGFRSIDLLRVTFAWLWQPRRVKHG